MVLENIKIVYCIVQYDVSYIINRSCVGINARVDNKDRSNWKTHGLLIVRSRNQRHSETVNSRQRFDNNVKT